MAPSTLQSLPPLRGKVMSWDDDFLGARASRPRSQVPNQQLINPFIAVHSCPFVVRRSPSCLSSWPFVVLRGPSWISFCLFPEILSPLPDHWRIPLKPSPTPWWPFVVLPAPSWITLFLSPHKFVPHPIDWAGYPVRSRLWVELVWPTKSSGCPIGRFHDRKTRHPSRLFRGTGADL